MPKCSHQSDMLTPAQGVAFKINSSRMSCRIAQHSVHNVRVASCTLINLKVDLQQSSYWLKDVRLSMQSKILRDEQGHTSIWLANVALSTAIEVLRIHGYTISLSSHRIPIPLYPNESAPPPYRIHSFHRLGYDVVTNSRTSSLPGICLYTSWYCRCCDRDQDLLLADHVRWSIGR